MSSEIDVTKYPCVVVSGEGSAQEPKRIDEDTAAFLASASPVKVLKFVTVPRKGAWGEYDVKEAVAYASISKKFYQVAFTKMTLAAIMASLEIDSENRAFTAVKGEKKGWIWSRVIQ